jgi:hypothetical protein
LSSGNSINKGESNDEHYGGKRVFNRRILALATIGALTACGQSGGGLGGMVQPGQIVGGGTKQIAGVLWEAVDKRDGTTAVLENTLNNWNDIDHAFQAWAEQLASRMQELGACRG